MPGYTSRYEGTEKIEFSDEFGDWWVIVKKCLTGGVIKECRARLIGYRVEERPDENGISDLFAVIDRVDPNGYSRELALASLLDWNITDGDGNKLPLDPEVAKRASYDMLDEVHRNKVEGVVHRLNAPPTSQQAAAFPPASERRKAPGTVTSPDDQEVGTGEVVVESAGDSLRPAPVG